MKRALCCLLALCWSCAATAQDFSLGPALTTTATASTLILPPTSKIELGVLGLSGPLGEFARVNGLGEGRLLALARATIDLRDPWNSSGTRYLRIDLDDLGWSNRHGLVRYGEQGAFELRGGFDQSQFRDAAGFLSPLRQVSRSRFQLDPAWPRVNGATASLAGFLRPVPLAVDRQKGKAGLTLYLPEGLRLALDVLHEDRSGQRLSNVAFGTDGVSAQALAYARPIDQTLDRLDLSLGRGFGQGQWRLSYRGIFFTDRISAIEVQNPFTALGRTALPSAVAYPNGFGTIADAPSSSAHQLGLEAQWREAAGTRINLSARVGMEQQDDPFLPYTGNTGLGITTPLPRTSLRGEVITSQARLSLHQTLSEDLDLDMSLGHHARDNRTPRDTWLYIIQDSQAQPRPAVPFLSANARINPTYSWAKEDARLSLSWHSGLGVFEARFTHDARFLDQQAARATRDNQGELAWHGAIEVLSFSLTGFYGERGVSAYRPNAVFLDTRPAILLAQFGGDPLVDHPLFRKYDVADRTRAGVTLRLDLDPTATFGFGLDGRLTREAYDRSTYGLRASDSARVDLDFHVSPIKAVRLEGFIGVERVVALQRGFDFSGPDLDDPGQIWRARHRDGTLDFGFGGEARLGSGVTFKGRAAWMLADGRDQVMAGASLPQAGILPDVTARKFTLNLDAHAKLDEATKLRLGYGFERLASRDWAYALGDPFAYAGLIGTGVTAPRFSVHLVSGSLIYVF